MTKSGGELATTRSSLPALAVEGELSAVERMERHAAWPMISRMPVTLAAGIPLRRFKVRDLLALVSGQVVESAWPATEDVPLKVGEVQLSWSEFEVVEQRMALRLTRLA